MRILFIIGLIIFAVSFEATALNNSCTEDPIDKSLICFNGEIVDPCKTGSGYGSMVCSRNGFNESNDKLNNIYKEVIAKMQPASWLPKSKSSFIHAHKKWIEWRDAMCLYELEANGGSRLWSESTKYSCLTKLSEARFRAFQQYLECHDEEWSLKQCILHHSISAQ
ncbi:lysozyme inhibitor LprI family protein [Shewanella colwelliana]|uniref:lysozyme inhibitor LprI family protein n=1 Tax=Shewanella colwelliana TaxID=23 RepID=UPI003CFF90F1